MLKLFVAAHHNIRTTHHILIFYFLQSVWICVNKNGKDTHVDSNNLKTYPAGAEGREGAEIPV